jgi:ABC-2 type transport system ATP-binding protein
MKPIIEFRNVTYAYKNTTALDALSFQIPSNSIVGLIGANGAGKTTSIHHIIRYLHPDNGEILYSGRDIYKLSSNMYPVAYIPDVPVFYEELTVQEHLSFIGAMYKTEEKISGLVHAFELQNHLEKVPASLSKGTRQKLSIACAFLRDSLIILADEPFAGLDPKQINILKSFILDEKCKGKTIILSTHLLSMIENICDYYVLLEQGKLLGQGKLEELMCNQKWKTLEEAYLQLSK